MSLFQRVIHFFTANWRYLSYIVLLIITFTYFIYIQGIPTFPDPDSFYHIKASILIPEQGIVTAFPWLQTTVLKDSYIDQHWLYHVFLTPFVTSMDPIQGAKLAHVLLSVGFFMLFYWFLRKHKVKFAFAFALILLATTPFVFRFSLVKAPVVSLIFLLLGLYCIFRYKYITLFFVSFFYVWAYGGFILMLVGAGLYALVSVFLDWVRPRKELFFNVVFRHSRELKLFFIALFGTVAGVIINPYFPENLSFYWHQLVKIGIVNYQKVIPVGNEWYPYNFIDLSSGTALVSLLLLGSLFMLIINRKSLTKKTVALFFLWLFFLIFTLKSRRYVEYYVPFAIIFSAFASQQFLSKFSWPRLQSKVIVFLKRHYVVATIVAVYFLVALPAIIVKDFNSLNNDFQNGISVKRFAQSATWLKEHTQPADIVFHSSWDEFPILFYYNSQNYYIAGLDPTFTYEYDQDLYKKMVDITTGNQRENVFEDINEKFNASFVFIEKSHTGMEEIISSTAGFRKVYTDDEATIYEVIKKLGE